MHGIRDSGGPNDENEFRQRKTWVKVSAVEVESGLSKSMWRRFNAVPALRKLFLDMDSYLSVLRVLVPRRTTVSEHDSSAAGHRE